jgi:hypothetical protein
MNAIAMRCEPGYRGSGRFDCSARSARIALMSRCRRPRSETESVSPNSSSAQRRAIRFRFSIGISGTGSAGWKLKIWPKK